ncbi:MAG: hypothetical protein JWQ42_746 [Edaphobacter sp.]|nr:hypothetical protein [Edaphobacter sp.]
MKATKLAFDSAEALNEGMKDLPPLRRVFVEIVMLE